MSEVVIPVIVTILVMLFLLGGAYGFIYYMRLRTQQLEALKLSTQTLLTASANLDNAFKEIKEAMMSMPVLVAGLTEVAKAQCAEMDKMVGSIADLRNLLFSDDKGRGYKEYAEADAGREYEVQQGIRSGLAPDEAEARVREIDIYRNMRISR